MQDLRDRFSWQTSMDYDEISGEPMADPVLEDEFEDFPILHSVVESGDETIIQTSRIGRDMIRELSAISAYSEPHIHVGQSASAEHRATDTEQDPSAKQQLFGIDVKLERVIEKHISALREEIQVVLRDALAVPDGGSDDDRSS